MDFERLLGILRRHWKAVVVVLVLTAVAAPVLLSRVAPDYKVQGGVIILSPSTVAGENNTITPVNPWARLGSAETGAAVALVQVLDSAETTEALVEATGVSGYTVTWNQANGAIIDISVTAADPDLALGGFTAILDRLESELRERQELTGAPTDTWLSVEALNLPTNAVVQSGSRMRLLVAIAALGVVFAVGVAIILDVVVEPRRRRRREAIAADLQEADDEQLVARSSQAGVNGSSGRSTGPAAHETQPQGRAVAEEGEEPGRSNETEGSAVLRERTGDAGRGP